MNPAATACMGFFVFGFAVVANLMTSRVVKPYPFVHWLGASVGAFLPLLVGCALFGLLRRDDSSLLVSLLMVAGIIGAGVEIPMLFGREIPSKDPFRRKALESLALFGFVFALGYLFIEYRFGE